jgi:hypothetical protein
MNDLCALVIEGSEGYRNCYLKFPLSIFIFAVCFFSRYPLLLMPCVFTSS